MSQKYKNFSKGSKQASECNSTLPPGVKRVGYLRKLKKMKRRFFVLHMDSDIRSSRLEYYTSEKKWKSGIEARRCIELRFCLNISHKPHSKYKNVIAIYTQDDCFCMAAESPEELELWLNDILEVCKCSTSGDENAKGRAVYEHLWQVVIDKHDLECSQGLRGPYRVALSSRALILIKMSPSNKCDYLEFPLMSIRRCGHSKDHFFIELGRSAVTGAGEIYMATEGTLIAQNMHETVLGAMKSSKIREDGSLLPRPRSASTSENSNPVASRRPVGIVAPQKLSTSNSCVLSDSRERCDSLPTRPKTLVENTYSGVILGALSSPYSSSGIATGRFSSRPHSMYEWPCFNTISARITNSHSHAKLPDSVTPSDFLITEVPDEYLMMSPTKETVLIKDGMNFEKGNISSCSLAVSSDANPPGYKQVFVAKNPAYMPMAHGGAAEETPVVLQEGYLTMAPATNSFPGTPSNDLNSFENSNVSFPFNQNIRNEDKDALISKTMIDKYETTEKKPIVSIFHPGSQSDPKVSIACVAPVKQAESSITISNMPSKSHLLNKIHQKSENQEIIISPESCKRDEYSKSNPVVPINNSSKVVKCIQIEENCEFGGNANFHENVRNVNTKAITISPSDQNTNFSCLIHSKRSSNSLLPCAYLCATSAEKTDSEGASTCILQEPKPNEKQKSTCSKYSIGVDVCDNSNEPVTIFQSSSTFPSSKTLCYNLPSKNVDTIIHSQDDYVNLEFKSPSGSILCPAPQIHTSQLLSPSHCMSSPSYTNVNLGKPFCPAPNPIPAKCETAFPCMATKLDQTSPSINVNSVHLPDSSRSEKLQKSPTTTLSKEVPKSLAFAPKFRSIPNTLPAFRKQMSAPAAPPSLRPELPSPGRKSSCPVTASASMVKPPIPVASIATTRLNFGMVSGHLKVSTSRSPDHSSVSSISSASDEISSNHSSPKTLNTMQNFHHNLSDNQYENVVLPQNTPLNSRTLTSSDEKELNYASLDLPLVKDTSAPPSSVQKPSNTSSEEPLLYAEIDFTKSEGLKNTSGIIREGRL